MKGKKQKEVEKIVDFKKERKILLYLFIFFLFFALTSLIYNYYFLLEGKKAEKILENTHLTSDEIRSAYKILRSQHIFSNIHMAEGKPSKENERKIYEHSLSLMKEGKDLNPAELNFFKIHPSYWLTVIEIAKINGKGAFNRQDKELLNVLLKVRKTAVHNGFIFTIHLSIITILLFIGFLLSAHLWKKKESKS